jgi:predicted transcriptional regulator
MHELIHKHKSFNNLKSNNLTENPFDFCNFREMRFIISSKPRSAVLLYLCENGPTNIDILRDIIKKPSPFILNAIRDLETSDFIKRIYKTFYLTSKGKILGLTFFKLIENMYVLKKNDFWTCHNLKQIPYHSLKQLYFLKDGEYISSTNNDLTKATEKCLDLIKHSNELKIIMPIFSEIHLDAIFESMVKHEGKLEIITNKKIYNLIFNNYSKEIQILNEKNRISFWNIDFDLKIFLINSNKFSLLNLFFKDGDYDDSIYHLDDSCDGIEWGLNLFNCYKDTGTKINNLRYKLKD